MTELQNKAGQGLQDENSAVGATRTPEDGRSETLAEEPKKQEPLENLQDWRSVRNEGLHEIIIRTNELVKQYGEVTA
ncbi:MAG TPA: hypothetical protein DIW34_01250, partial [Oribacterium sp.]|nr:hypothetical protein [Oribacterium sp.]